jgi:hypothetical protein
MASLFLSVKDTKAIGARINSLDEMERRRESLYKQLQKTGDFRRGKFLQRTASAVKRIVLVLRKDIRDTVLSIYGIQQLKGKATQRA